MKFKINITALIQKYLSLFCISLMLFPMIAIADSIDNYLQCKMSKLKIPGLSLAIVKNGEVVKTKGYGFSNIELQAPAKPETIYQSGSIGKQFTAMLAMILYCARSQNAVLTH